MQSPIILLQLEVYPNFKSNYCTVKRTSMKKLIVMKPPRQDKKKIVKTVEP
jgi:hypothetical protein